MTYKQRDIVLLPFPYSDLTGSKKRPGLVISNNNFNQNQKDVICCVITTNPATDTLSVQVSDADVEQGKLYFQSRIKTHRVFATDKKIILKKLCALKKEKFNEVITQLHKITSKV